METGPAREWYRPPFPNKIHQWLQAQQQANRVNDQSLNVKAPSKSPGRRVQAATEALSRLISHIEPTDPDPSAHLGVLLGDLVFNLPGSPTCGAHNGQNHCKNPPVSLG
jgi:hypothetical protein